MNEKPEKDMAAAWRLFRLMCTGVGGPRWLAGEE
jgi:hypothetical protein